MKQKTTMGTLLIMLIVGMGCSDSQPEGTNGQASAEATNSTKVEQKADTKSVNWDPDLKKEVDAFAACEQKNTNCPAYATLEKFLKDAAKDEKKKVANFDALMSCVDTGSVEEVHACSYAAWAFSGYAYEAPKKAEYGKRLLAAAKKLKVDEPSYVGYSVGQFLASWLTHAELKGELAQAMVNGSIETRARAELIRLCGTDCSKEDAYFASLKKVLENESEKEELRTNAITTLSRVVGADRKMEVEGLFLKNLSHSSDKIGRSAMQALGTMGSVESFSEFLKFSETKKADQVWTYQIGSTLVGYFQRSDLAIDHKKAIAFASGIASDTSIPAFHRASVIRSLGYTKDPSSAKILKKLAGDKDKDIAKAANEAIAKQAK